MRSCGKIQMAVSIVLACSALTSCAPTETQGLAEKVSQNGSEGKISVAKAPLSREQILEVADAVARERGYFPEAELRRIYDEGNTLWKRSYGDVDSPGLRDHNYQVVIYRRGGTVVLDGELLVFVDRNTGAVLKVLPPRD